MKYSMQHMDHLVETPQQFASVTRGKTLYVICPAPDGGRVYVRVSRKAVIDAWPSYLVLRVSVLTDDAYGTDFAYLRWEYADDCVSGVALNPFGTSAHNE